MLVTSLIPLKGFNTSHWRINLIFWFRPISSPWFKSLSSCSFVVPNILSSSSRCSQLPEFLASFQFHVRNLSDRSLVIHALLLSLFSVSVTFRHRSVVASTTVLRLSPHLVCPWQKARELQRNLCSECVVKQTWRWLKVKHYIQIVIKRRNSEIREIDIG